MNDSLSRSLVNVVLACLALSLVTACQEDVETPDTQSKIAATKKKVNKAKKKKPANDADATRVPVGDASSDATANSSEDVQYPQVEYRSILGKATTAGGEATLKHNFTTIMTKSSFTIKTTKWHSSNAEGNDAVRKWNDTTDYVTVDPVASSDSPAKPATGATFLIFASSAANNQGEKISFSQPIPVMVQPGPSSRFEEIKKGPFVYKARVSGASNFDITCKVSYVSGDDKSARVRIDYTIPEPAGKAGFYYRKIPMFKASSYLVNTEAKNIESLNTSTLSYSDKYARTINVTLNYQLCAKTQQGKRETFNGCP